MFQGSEGYSNSEGAEEIHSTDGKAVHKIWVLQIAVDRLSTAWIFHNTGLYGRMVSRIKSHVEFPERHAGVSVNVEMFRWFKGTEI